ncbi:MAG: D-aminoacylase [Saprospiraceae bacterium]|nr:D-aminoacylase [Saprospiraceae bacterium]MBK9929393.1 D-aminoacylase [Saprospiraceae bacterium]
MYIIRLVLLCALSLNFASAQNTILIKNGRILDGTGNSWYYSDLYVSNGIIQHIGKNLQFKADKIIDAHGLIVAPGFIDVHAHIEGGIMSKSTADNYLFDGVTTVVTGNCGNSAENLAEFFNRLDSLGVSINVASLVGHNTVRNQVMKMDARPPTTGEQKQMEVLVERGMKAGAVGLSTGLIYVPGTYSNTDEIIGLAKQIAKLGGVYASHIRNEGDSVEAAINEAITIGREANLPVEISHFKVTGKNNWGSSAKTLWMIEAARRSGVEVTVDQYPYTASSTNLHSRIPSWALAGGNDSLHIRLQSAAIKSNIIKEMSEDLKQMRFTDYTYAVVAYCSHDTSLNGKNIHEINLKWKRPATIESEINTLLDIADHGGAQMVYHQMSEEDVRNIMQSPYNMIGADGGVQTFGRGVPHPRSYGTNSRVLGKYVREEKVLSLEEAVRRMTSLPAQKFGFKERGLLREGYKADIVLFDPEKVSDQATYEKPHAYAEGFEAVIVNGQLTIWDRQHTGAKGGKVILGPAKEKS